MVLAEAQPNRPDCPPPPHRCEGRSYHRPSKPISYQQSSLRLRVMASQSDRAESALTMARGEGEGRRPSDTITSDHLVCTPRTSSLSRRPRLQRKAAKLGLPAQPHLPRVVRSRRPLTSEFLIGADQTEDVLASPETRRHNLLEHGAQRPREAGCRWLSRPTAPFVVVIKDR